MTISINNFNELRIQKLLFDLDAPSELYNELAQIINAAYLGIYPNQIINALNAAMSIKHGNTTIAILASMQSGKTDTAFVLCNYILPSLGLLKEDESVVFITSMRDTDLYAQNLTKLERDTYNFKSKKRMRSQIRVEKMNRFLKFGGVIIRDFNVKYVIRDEDQYGCGHDSSFDRVFFQDIRSKFPNLSLICISATPYDILDSKLRGNEVEVIEGERPDNYFGITEMLNQGFIYDLPKNYRALEISVVNGKNLKCVHPIIRDSIEYLNEFDDGFGIIRVSNTKEAFILKKELKIYEGEKFNVLMIGSSQDCDLGIKDGLKSLYDIVVRRKIKTVLIIINALTAGKDLGALKEKVRFGIEPRKSQLANGAQGIPGRLCGYHGNRNFILFANEQLLNHYSEFEMDSEIYADEQWRYYLYKLNKIKSLSTHTFFKEGVKEGYFSKIIETKKIDVDDLFSNSIFVELEFLDRDAVIKLRSFFHKEFYSSKSKNVSLTPNVSIRTASSYVDAVRLYREWDSEIDDNFSRIFFRSGKFIDYGILISNYPKNHELNAIGFCGIQVFKSGPYNYTKHQTVTENYSMYVENDE